MDKNIKSIDAGCAVNITAVFVLAAIVSLNAYYYFYWMADDSYISIRYALNFIYSGGVFYNAHENATGLVQGFSNPGMMPIYILLLKFTPDAMLALKFLGVFLYFCSAVIVYFLCRRFEVNRGIAFIGSVVIASSPILGVPSASGLETIFLCFFLTLSLWLLTSTSSILKVVSAFSFAYCASMRPEGLALVAVLVVAFLIEKISNRNAFFGDSAQTNQLFGRVSNVWILLFFALVFTFLLWQYSTYNSFFPNTSTTKTAGSGIESFFTLDRYKYLFDFFAYNPSYSVLWVAAFTIFFGSFFKCNLAPIRLLSILLCMPGIALAILGKHDYFPNFRYLAPYFPIFVFFTALNINYLISNSKYKVILSLFFVAISVAGLAMDIRTDSVMNNKFSFSPVVDASDKDFKNFRKFNGSYWAPFPRQSDLFSLFTPESGIVSYGNIGRPGINSMDVQIVDTAGLVTKDFALFRSRNIDGEKRIISLLKNYKPSIYVIGDGDRALQELVEPLMADGYLEKDWLKSDHEKVLISKDIYANDGGSTVPISVAIKRQKDTHILFPHDYLAAARYRDLLYLGQRTHELKELLAEFKKNPDFLWYSSALTEMLEFPFYSDRANDETNEKIEIQEDIKSNGVSIDLRRQDFLTFKAFNFNVGGAKNSKINLKAEICTATECISIGGSSIMTNDNGQGRLSVVFDRFKLLFPIQPVPKIINPELVYQYAGLPFKADASHAVLVLPDNIPQKINGVINVSIEGVDDGELQLAGIR